MLREVPTSGEHFRRFGRDLGWRWSALLARVHRVTLAEYHHNSESGILAGRLRVELIFGDIDRDFR